MICPVCEVDAEPSASVGAVSICSTCGATVYLDDVVARQAVVADLEDLSDVDLKRLRRARGAIARPTRRQR